MAKSIGTVVKVTKTSRPGSNTTLGREPSNHRVQINLDIHTRDATYMSQDIIVYSGPDEDVADRLEKDLQEPPHTIKVWCNWYAAKLERINVQLSRGESPDEGYSGAEQDLFEAFGCRTFDF